MFGITGKVLEWKQNRPKEIRQQFRHGQAPLRDVPILSLYTLPESCSQAAGPVLLVTHEPSPEVILYPPKRNKGLLHYGSFSSLSAKNPDFGFETVP